MVIDDKTTQINTFAGGMNTDVSDLFLDNKQYRFAKNLRYTTDTDSNTGELHLVQGVSGKYSITDQSNLTLLKSTQCRDTGVLILKRPDNSWAVYTFSDTTSPHKIFGWCTTKLGDALSVVTRYEDQDNQKLYIADGINGILVIDILHPYDNTDINVIRAVPAVYFKKPIFGGLTSGQLKAGMVQYSYQLYNKFRQQSEISPATRLIPIIKGNMSDQINNVAGYEKDSISDKGVVLSIPIDEDNNIFDHIKIYRISYIETGQLPTIECIYDGLIDASDAKQIPDIPDTPDTPDIPDTPYTPTQPDTPTKPDTPDKPDTPTKPDQPTQPDNPSTPTQPTNQRNYINYVRYSETAVGTLNGTISGVNLYFSGQITKDNFSDQIKIYKNSKQLRNRDFAYGTSIRNEYYVITMCLNDATMYGKYTIQIPSTALTGPFYVNGSDNNAQLSTGITIDVTINKQRDTTYNVSIPSGSYLEERLMNKQIAIKFNKQFQYMNGAPRILYDDADNTNDTGRFDSTFTNTNNLVYYITPKYIIPGHTYKFVFDEGWVRFEDGTPSPQITLTYNIVENVDTTYTVSIKPGTYKLDDINGQSIRITFNKNIQQFNSRDLQHVDIYDKNDNAVYDERQSLNFYFGQVVYDGGSSTGNQFRILVKPQFDLEAGLKYVITFDEGWITFEDGSYNPKMILTYTIT